MRMLVLGAKGVLGKEVCAAANNLDYELYFPDRSQVDITDCYSIHDCFFKFRPEIVINCAGLVKNRDYSDFKYILVNGVAPHWIASECDYFNAKLIHISTDCVFSGRRGLYTEDDIPDPVDIYGKSKLAGEVIRHPHLTIRSSFIGFGERGLLAWLMSQKGEVNGYTDSLWNGLTATELARIIVYLVETDMTGILHIHSKDIISKYDLLEMAANYLNLPVKIIPSRAPVQAAVDRSLKSIKYINDMFKIPSMSHMLEELSIINKMMSSI